ncbi:1469_t:CDS:2 [Diversispora eburnea]|uniref:1469_t:CDS:1 n=1 Tax=Diversispora eburnea TaxID=1213867 RepID=A0A9N9BBD3_9GLOM|nr:1469_t:CDS:2 [Diversispora eburnea]
MPTRLMFTIIIILGGLIVWDAKPSFKVGYLILTEMWLNQTIQFPNNYPIEFDVIESTFNQDVIYTCERGPNDQR